MSRYIEYYKRLSTYFLSMFETVVTPNRAFELRSFRRDRNLGGTLINTILAGAFFFSVYFANATVCSSHFRDSLDSPVQSGNNSTYTNWLRGESEPPFGQSVQVSWTGLDGSAIMRFERLSSQPNPMRRLLRKVKTASWTRNNSRQREYNAAVAMYDDGSEKVAEYTSNEFDVVWGKDASKALNRSGLFANRNIVGFTTVHSHPYRPGDRSNAIFSSDDFETFKSLKQQLGAFLKLQFSLMFILVPNCDGCEDVIVKMSL